MPNKHKSKPGLAEIIPKMCHEIAHLDSGSLARLRRMDPLGPGEAEFWKLAIFHELHQTDQVGMMLVKLLALLTPKGQSDIKQLHKFGNSLGKVLAANKNGKPLLSEMRLMRFIALPFEKRPESLERICRLIASNGHKGLDCVDLARLLFYHDVKHTRNLARHYFSNLKGPSTEKETVT